MIAALLRVLLEAAADLDRRLQGALGKPYGIFLTVGLMLEIIRRAREVAERVGALPGLAVVAFFLALNLGLLIHQLGELSERWSGKAEPAQVAAPVASEGGEA